MTPEEMIEAGRNAPSGTGPWADTWKDKPHRIVYDLASALGTVQRELADLRIELSLLQHDYDELEYA